MKQSPELTALKTVLARNADDTAFLNSFESRIAAASELAHKLYCELAADPCPATAERFFEAQRAADVLPVPCRLARQAVVETIFRRIGERSRPAIRDAMIAAAAKLEAELEDLDTQDRRRCEALGVDFDEFSKLSPVRNRLLAGLDGLKVAVPQIDTISPSAVPTYAKLCTDILDK
jgi:hypothetical protein